MTQKEIEEIVTAISKHLDTVAITGSAAILKQIPKWNHEVHDLDLYCLATADNIQWLERMQQEHPSSWWHIKDKLFPNWVTTNKFDYHINFMGQDIDVWCYKELTVFEVDNLWYVPLATTLRAKLQISKGDPKHLKSIDEILAAVQSYGVINYPLFKFSV